MDTIGVTFRITGPKPVLNWIRNHPKVLVNGVFGKIARKFTDHGFFVSHAETFEAANEDEYVVLHP